jgi:cytidine deaminase
MAASTTNSMALADKDGLIHGLSDVELKALSANAIEAKEKAYCPYSLFRVGCALLINTPNSSSPSLITGANTENASYPVGTCAERVAMGSAIHSGHRLGSFKAIGVATDMDDFCSPCGMCRQFLREFCELDTPVFMFDKGGKWVVKTLGELLPMSFGPDVLPSRETIKKREEESR